MTDAARLSEAAAGKLSWRSINLSDVEQWHRLLKRMAAVDEPDWVETQEDLEHSLSSSKDNPQLDTVVGLDHEGSIRAFALVTKNPGSTLLHGFGGVDPQWRGRGIGSALIEWQAVRGVERLAEDNAVEGVLRAYVEERNVGQKSLFTSDGGEVVRYFTEMTRPLGEELPDVPLAEGFEFVTFDERISDAVRRAHNDAFRDHWGSEPRDEESWHFTVSHPEFKPDWSVAVVDTSSGEIAAYQMASHDAASAERVGLREGYTELLGVRRQWRGHRLAPALLVEAMRRFLEGGMDNAGLGVDTENPSGALGLYERLGYAATQCSLVFERRLTVQVPLLQYSDRELQ
ncbi:GNAT family N-acetyltransferase [Arthrobacter roseus]|uniref:GNAT family N-acetyltransferase n=1 Tax=Arthrobacter roseus TaxID=136274 RepID=UPI001EF76B43|nr:GNAT family N-acetyltransferase [Arthrobacter roseus]MBM7848376.1 ribosomal protein S18 acetylase RimI-like enzyme [Arthrobacter roseus]